MENYMEPEKRPAHKTTEPRQPQSEQGLASLSPPALQLKVTQFEGPEEEEELQMKKVSQFQMPEEEEMMQSKMAGSSIQRKESGGGGTGSPSTLPDSLSTSASEQLQGDFSDVKVFPNSQKASELGALAYTQGTDIHFAPNAYDPHSSSGKSLIGHELTHVVQQSQGRVNATGEIDGMPLNDDTSLEREADEMGNKLAGH